MTEKNKQEETTKETLSEEEKKQEEIDYSSAKQGKFFINLFIALILLIPIMYIMNICQG
jgi:lipopolysaccharide/colanic/teichoic acid biosynthesis glycosyltransferase|tara:strand:- start:283 stop:459 length:177 start_codon:yes stop_codon:yes gene_type:complete